MNDKSKGRLYSRKNGWENGQPIKCFHSLLIDKLPRVEDIDMNGKNGFYILNYLTKNNLGSEYTELFNNCKVYNNWYFYYGDNIEIFSQDSP